MTTETADPFEAAYDALVPDATPAPDAAPEADAQVEDTAPDDSEDAPTEDNDTEAPEGDEEVEDDGDGEQPTDGESEDDEGEDPASPRQPIAVQDDDEITLPDGSTITVKDAALRQADYTRKTQALSKERDELEEQKAKVEEEVAQARGLYDQVTQWYEDRQSDPAGWVGEIAESSGNPTYVIAAAIKTLADQGRLDPGFVKSFGIDSPEHPVHSAADRGAEAERIRRLEERLENQDRSAKEQTERQQRVSEYRRQYDSIVQDYGLTFDSAEAETEFKTELVQYAEANNLDRVDVAYRAWAFEKGQGQNAPAPSPEKPPLDPKKKRATRAVTPRSSTPGAKPAPPKKALSVEDAAMGALDAFASRG